MVLTSTSHMNSDANVVRERSVLLMLLSRGMSIDKDEEAEFAKRYG